MNIFDYESAILKIKLLIYNFANPENDTPGNYLGDIHELLCKPVYDEMDWLVSDRTRLRDLITDQAATTQSGAWATVSTNIWTSSSYKLVGDTTTIVYPPYVCNNNLTNSMKIKRKKSKNFYKSKAIK